jgi:hypothetical protein
MIESCGVLVLTATLIAIPAFPNEPGAGEPPQPRASAFPSGQGVGPQGITPVNVLIKNSCGHQVTPPTAKLHTTTKDLLRWKVINNCAQAQPVLVCVYDGTTKLLKNPFKLCMPDPNVHDIGKTFIVAAHGQDTFDCAAEDPNFHGKYKKQVRVGAAEVPASGCPTIFQQSLTKPVSGKNDPVKIYLHALDVEVVP